MEYNDLINIDIEFNANLLLDEAQLTDGYTTFIDPKTNNPINGWLIKRISSGYAFDLSNYLKDRFKLNDCRPRFYIQEPGISIPFHTDRGTKCSFNFVLSDNPDPISFRDRTVIYKTALLNTSIEHAVLNPKTKRILFKVSVLDKTFKEIRDVLPLKLQFR
jgi:hypothetical protein